MRTFVVLVSLLAACGGSAPPTPAPVVATPTPAPAPAPAKPTFPVPDTPPGKQLGWVLDVVLNRNGKLERAELDAHFHASFLAQMPAEKLTQIFAQMGAQLVGLKVTSLDGEGNRLVAHTVVGDTKLRIVLVVDDATKQISGLLVRADIDAGPRPKSFDEALHAIAATAPKAQLLVASLDNGACKPMQQLASSEQLAIGSTFKLYVLLGLADRILGGKAAWTDELAIRDDWKSLPSGTMQNELPGTKHALRQFAEQMISISDNTAADHLLYTLGRRAVETALKSTKHARPQLDIPFLSTRELFVLKLGTAEEDIARYLKMNEAARRTYLDKTLATKVPRVDLIPAWTKARHVDTLEWFASADDLCRTMAALWTRGQNPRTAPVLDILAKNPGLPIDAKTWPYVGFKGGSEPGVVNMTYLLRRDDDRWFVVVLGFNAAEGGRLEDNKIFGLTTELLALLGRSR